MLAVNLGTRGAAEARELVEYVNGVAGTRGGDRRIANGHRDPHGVRTWCLGNEMDGPWQIGATTAAEYGRRAADCAAAMRAVDPAIELVVCGSSAPTMPTFGSWERTVLDLTWESIDHVSLHLYVDPAAFDSTEAYLDGARALDDALATVAGIIDDIAARKGSARRIGISVGEWNVWRLSDHLARDDPSGPFRHAPAIAEDTADVTDALVVGSLLLTLLRHAARVRIACIAQLVNVIPLIRTVDGGPAWMQPTAYPFADVARAARGVVLRTAPDGPRLDRPGGGWIKAIELAATHDPGAGTLALFVINRATTPLRLEAEVDDDDLEVTGHTVLHDGDPRATNTAGQPRRVVSRRATSASLDRRRLTIELPPRSWSTTTLRSTAGVARP
jgi:alpha-N-arabinofuranosidase